MIEANAVKITHFVRLAKAQLHFLEDQFAAVETATRCLRHFKMTYTDFQEQFLKIILDQDAWGVEAAILQPCVDEFLKSEDAIMALERLCLIYEKKTHNEDYLRKSFEKLLRIDEFNIKALKYFKLIHTQSGEWVQVSSILQKMLAAPIHQQDRYRYAQELAGVFLYQLDLPEDCIKIIDGYCADSYLDTSTIHYDAYQRMGKWDGCLGVLLECLKSVKDNSSSSILHFKAGVLLEQMGQEQQAMNHYRQSIELWPRFILPVEKVIAIEIRRERWDELLEMLRYVHGLVKDNRSEASLGDVIDRLKEGLNVRSAEA